MAPPHEIVALLTAGATPAAAHLAMRRGAAGFLAKTGDRVELLLAIDEVCAGRPYVTPHLQAVSAPFALARDQFQMLTPAEQAVVMLLGRGLTTTETAQELGLSERGVYYHRNEIHRRLGLHHDAELVRFAVLATVVGSPSLAG